MYQYLIISEDSECNVSIRILHENKFSEEQFNKMVEEAIKEIVEETLKKEKYNWISPGSPMPWWEHVYANVANNLCEKRGFQKEMIEASFGREYSMSWINFCPDAEELKEKYLNDSNEKQNQSITKCPNCASDICIQESDEDYLSHIYHCTICGYEWKIG